MAKQAKVPIYYFDTCVFLALINKEKDRYHIVEAILDDADNKECEVHTSQLSVTEVAYGAQEKQGKALSTKAKRDMDKLWHPDSPVRLVDVHPNITLEARELIRLAMEDGWAKNEEWSLGPPDAIHLATAKQVGASPVFTYDLKLITGLLQNGFLYR